MNILIEDQHFLPHCRSQVSLTLEKSKLNLIKGVNGIGKSTFAAAVKKRHSSDTTFIEQGALVHFYNRTLLELKNIFIKSGPQNFDQDTLEELWQELGLAAISDHELTHLSGGENQSLKLALGLSIKKNLVILDEPAQYLDVKRKATLASFLKRLMCESYILIIEHDSSWLEELTQQSFEFYVEDKTLRARHD